MSNIITPEQAVQHLFFKQLREGYVLDQVYTYYGCDEQILYYSVRLKHSNGEKYIRPMHIDSQGIYKLGEPPELKGKLKPLYDSQLLSQYTTATVFIVEGEMPAHKLNQFFYDNDVLHKYIAVTSGSATSANSADWQPLMSRTCKIWPDNDDPGFSYATTVNEKLKALNCRIEIINGSELNLKPGGDCVDWLINNPNATVEDIEKLPLVQLEVNPEPAECNKQSAQLLELFKDAELFSDDHKEPFVTFNNGDHAETWAIKSDHFSSWSSYKFWQAYEKPISDYAKREACSVMSGKALYIGECHKVYSRVGLLVDKIYAGTIARGQIPSFRKSHPRIVP